MGGAAPHRRIILSLRELLGRFSHGKRPRDFQCVGLDVNRHTAQLGNVVKRCPIHAREEGQSPIAIYPRDRLKTQTVLLRPGNVGQFDPVD
jgi:hypothetical protein